jgi:hypothetical protein
MKKILFLFFALFCGVANSQTFTTNNLTVNGNQSVAGTSAFTGQSTFTLSPTIPTPAAGDNSTKAATTAFDAAGKPCPSILDHGGNNSGSVDNTAAFAATLAVGPTGQACVFFPPGTYEFTSASSYSLPGSQASVMLEGAGADVSTLYFPSTNGITLNLGSPYHSFHVRDMTIAGGTANTYNGLTLNQSSPEGAFFQSDVSNVSFRSSTPGANGWANAIVNNGVSAVNFTGDYFLNDANDIALEPSSASPFYGQDYNISNCTFFGVAGQTGIIYGSYIQAVQVTNNYFVNLGTAVSVPASESGVLEGLQFTGNSVATASYGINVNTAVSQVDISNNLFTSAVNNTATQVSFGATSNTTIVGNSFTGSGSGGMSGILMEGTVANTGATITGNTFTGLNSAVTLTSTANAVNVQSNTYRNNSSNVTNGNGAGACPPSATQNCLGTSSTP